MIVGNGSLISTNYKDGQLVKTHVKCGKIKALLSTAINFTAKLKLKKIGAK